MVHKFVNWDQRKDTKDPINKEGMPLFLNNAKKHVEVSYLLTRVLINFPHIIAKVFELGHVLLPCI